MEFTSKNLLTSPLIGSYCTSGRKKHRIDAGDFLVRHNFRLLVINNC